MDCQIKAYLGDGIFVLGESRANHHDVFVVMLVVITGTVFMFMFALSQRSRTTWQLPPTLYPACSLDDLKYVFWRSS